METNCGHNSAAAKDCSVNIPLNPSEATKRRNPHLYPPVGGRAGAKLEPGPGNAAAGKDQAQNHDLPRYRVRITSVRKRLCDADNLCVKHHIDAIRKLGLIPDDSPAVIELIVRQRTLKEAFVKTEGTQIEVEEICREPIEP